MEPTQTRPSGTVDIWFDAAVWCTDGDVGTVAGVVCTVHPPYARDVVVRDPDRGHREHPVTLRRVTGSGPYDLTIDMSAAQIRDRHFHTETVLLSDAPVWWADIERENLGRWLPEPQPLQVPVTVPVLEPNHVVVHRHAAVYAGGHHVGRLAGLQADRSTGRVTAAIIDVGHRWHHRYVLVPAASIAEVSEWMVTVHGATRGELRHMPPPTSSREHEELSPIEPHDLGLDDRDTDSAHAEAAALLADEAHHMLQDRGFTDSEIRHWADAYLRQERSGDAARFVDWIEAREHAR